METGAGTSSWKSPEREDGEFRVFSESFIL